MKIINKSIILLIFLPLLVFLASCSKTAENEHLPEYCQTYSGFMATASRDLYELVDGINRDEYLTSISVIELEFDSNGFDHDIDLSGIQCFQNLTSLTLTGPGFKDISPISALKNIQKISLIDTSIVSIDSFKNLSKIKELIITGTKTLQSVDGVEEMIKLTRLELTNNGIVNIDGLNNLINLEELVLSENEISFFPDINQLTKLTKLDVSYNKIYILGDDLSGLSSLETLNMSYNDICDLSTLDDLTSLIELDLGFNNLGCDGSGLSPDFTSLENSTHLDSIKLNDNDLDSIEGLRGLDIPLKTLELQNNNLVDITPIGEYTGITRLVLYSNNIQNISDLSGMTGLKEIDLSDNVIIDFSDLLSINNLDTINLSQNNIVSIPDLVTVDEEYWPHLISLDLSTNNLNDISGVEGHSNIQELLIADNGLTTISGLSDLPMLNTLEMTWEDPDPETYPTEDDWPEGFYSVTNHNEITRIDNSFNNLPDLPLVVIENEGLSSETITSIFDFGFDLGEGLEIYGSINGLLDIAEIDFSGLDIDVIDNQSINLVNLEVIDVSDTNIEDIDFILGNPELISLDISNTAVSNLSVISGLTTSDLDNLDQVNASNISGDNNLLNAFIELPELSFIDLTGTNILSIENCFNSVVELSTLRIDSTELESIVDSFNDIFDYYTVDNIIQFNSSKIGIIDGSFNGGNYEFIEIIDSINSGITTINSSFNDITTSELGYIIISGNDFRIVDDSFNNLTTSNLFLGDNYIEVITNSFVNLDITGELNIQNNRLATLAGIDQVTSVPSLDLSNNRLNTVSFLDDIAGLTTLDISHQENLDVPENSLLIIDGINNMPNLDTIVMDDLAITEIDGFKDIGITEFYLNYSDNSDIVINSITSDSFSNNVITELDFTGHDLNNIDFLTNFTSLTNLSISFNLADISYFDTAVFESGLESLVIENVQDTTDFSYLSEYDNLTFLRYDGLSTLSINNLDGLDSLNNISFGNADNLLEFNNSFNNMPSLTLFEGYLSITYSALTTIDSSFDIYTSEDAVVINGLIEVIDSFNNVGEVTLASDLETTFNIDALSFDNMDSLTILVSNHDSFAILDNYLNLNNLVIENLNKNITDLSNSNITSLTIENTDTLVDTFTLDISPTGTLSVFSETVDTLTFNTSNNNYNLDIQLGNTILNLDNTSADIQGIYSNLTVNSSNVEIVDFSDFAADTTTFNTDALYQVVDNTLNSFGTSMTVNSLEPTLNIDMNSNSLYINDINVDNLTLVTNAGFTYINSDQPDLVVDFYGTYLYAEYNLLESISLTGNIINEVILTSTNLDTATFNDAIIARATINSDQAIFNVTGINVTNVDIINDSINNLTADTANANVTLTTSNNEILNLTLDLDVLNLLGLNIPSVIASSSSIAEDLNINIGDSINTLTLNDAAIANLNVLSNETSIDISGTNVTNVILDMDNLDSITTNTVNATYNIGSLVATFDLDMIANTVEVTNNNLTNLNILSTSDIDTLSVLNSPLINTVTANDSNITELNLISESINMDITGTNVLYSIISNGLITSFTADLGLNDFEFTTSKTGSASFNINADEVTLNTLLSIISIDSSSNVAQLDFQSPNLSNLITGSANLDILITGSNVDLQVTGSNISDLSINSQLTSLDLSVGLGTNAIISNNAFALLSITTSTSDIVIDSLGDIDLTSSTLTSSTLEIGSNDATLNLSAPALDYTLNGQMANLSIDSTTMNNLNIGLGMGTNTLELLNTNITTLDLTPGDVNELSMSGNTSSLDVIGTQLSLVDLDLPNLNDLTVNSSFTNSLVNILSSDTSLDLNGDVQGVIIDENALITVDLTDVVLDNLTINSDALTSLNTLSSVAITLDITTNNDFFNLTTDTPVVNFNSSITHNLNLSTNTATDMNLTTNVDSINFVAPTTEISIFGDNLNNLEGNANTININNTETGTLTVDMDLTSFLISSNNYSQIDFTGVRTITDTIINGYLLTDINTNSVTMDSLSLLNIGLDINIETEVDVLSIETTLPINATLNYDGNTLLDLTLSGIDGMEITANLSSEVTLSGDSVDLTLIGNIIDTVDTTLLTVSNKYTMNNTLINDLGFISTGLAASLVELEVNTLDSINTTSIVEALRDSGITLFSPITETDIYDDFYDSEFADLTAQEALDSLRYNGFRDTAILDAFTEIRTNTYFDHILDGELNTIIDDQSYGDMQSYLDRYVISITTTEAQLIIDNGEPFVQAIRDSIQATLDETVLVIVELDLTNSVNQSIIDDSTTYATTESDLVGFTIG